MNGVGTGIGASTPAVVGYLGKVSYAQYSPSVTRAKLHSNLVCIVWKLYRIDPPPQMKKKTRKSVCKRRKNTHKSSCVLYINCL